MVANCSFGRSLCLRVRLVQDSLGNELFALYQGTTSVVALRGQMVRALAPATVKSARNSDRKTQGLKSLRENSRIWEARGAHRRSLRYATPDFLLTLVALVHFMRPSLRKGAHAALSSAAWQEIRVRSGRDDNFVWER